MLMMYGVASWWYHRSSHLRVMHFPKGSVCILLCLYKRLLQIEPLESGLTCEHSLFWRRAARWPAMMSIVVVGYSDVMHGFKAGPQGLKTLCESSYLGFSGIYIETDMTSFRQHCLSGGLIIQARARSELLKLHILCHHLWDCWTINRTDDFHIKNVIWETLTLGGLPASNLLTFGCRTYWYSARPCSLAKSRLFKWLEGLKSVPSGKISNVVGTLRLTK